MFNLDYLKKMNNSLEQLLLKISKIKNIKLFLENYSKPAFVRMTGSGSALVAYFQSKERCEMRKKSLIKNIKITGV